MVPYVPSSNIIPADIGRVVLFFPGGQPGDLVDLSASMPAKGKQPMAATIAFAHSDSHVNLSVVDHDGRQHALTDILLV